MFKDRQEAGQKLAKKLDGFKAENGIVLGIPRGGVVPAFMIAKTLSWPLDVFISQKIPAPLNPEVALGAVTEAGTVALNDEIINTIPNIDPDYVAEETAKKEKEIKDRITIYRGGKPLQNLKNKAVILVDDGVATGFTTLAALDALKNKGAAKVIVAVPVIPADTAARIAEVADIVITLITPEVFFAVGQFYANFPQVSDEEVIKLLQKK